MSHQDLENRYTSGPNLKDLFQFSVPDSTAEFTRHGNARIKPRMLATIAIACWGLSTQRTLTQRVSEAVAAVRQCYRLDQTITRQGLLKALASCGESLAALVAEHVYSQLRQLKGHWTTVGKATFAVDGTKFAAPRTAANQRQFSVTKQGHLNRRGKQYRKKADAQKAKTVQVLLTLFWHVGSGLPACWRTANAHGSERKLATEMLDELPTGARIVGDAEYIGYPLWSAIIESGRSFLVRVGSNASLLKQLDPRLKRHGDLVHCWPKTVRKQGAPLALRLIQIQTPRGVAWLLSNEFDLTNRQLGELYRARWGVEVFFRTVKQTCRRAKLSCLTPVNVRTELTWTLLGIWAALFSAKLELRRSGVPIDRLSPIRVFDQLAAGLARAAYGQTVLIRLLDCLKPDESSRLSSKQSRDYPRKKKCRPCGKPRIRDATPQEIEAAKKFLGQKQNRYRR